MDIDPKDTVDRDAQKELFEDLLQFNSKARLLRVHDKPGTGKSTLLKKLQQKCSEELDKPVSFVALQDFASRTNFELIGKIRQDLPSLEFQEFDRLLDAYKIQDALTFNAIGRASGKVDLGGATVSGGTIGGVIGTVNQPTNQYIQNNYNPIGPWHSGLEKYAEEQCIKEFLRELKEVCATQDVVLLFDSWDISRTSSERRDWLTQTLIRPYSLDPALRPARLIVVVAGEDAPDFKTLWKAKYSDSVRESPFETWNKDHVVAFLKVHGFKDLAPKYIELIWELMKDGASLQDAIDMAVLVQEKLKRRAG